MAFPPKNASKGPGAAYQPAETGAVSTGKGGIKASLRVKAAGTKNLPYPDKTVSQF